MRREPLLLCCFATAAIGCSSSKETSVAQNAPAVTTGSAAAGSGSAAAPAVAAAPAGRVLEVAGTVTASGKALAVGDAVAADATIETGADGNVVIELVHNLARWELGPNKHVRVDQSLAWKEPKHTGPVAEVEQETTSAGQPAERTAASTTTSAVGKGDLEKILKGGSDSLGGGGLGITGTGPGGGGGGGGGLGIGSIGPIGHGGGTGQGQGYGNGGGRLGGGGVRGPNPSVKQGAPVIQGKLPAEVIKRVVRMRTNQVRYCYEKGLARNPTLAGTLTVKFVIGPDGKVMSVAMVNDTLADTDVTSCITGRVQSWEFPTPTDGIVVVTYPFVFTAE